MKFDLTQIQNKIGVIAAGSDGNLKASVIDTLIEKFEEYVNESEHQNGDQAWIMIGDDGKPAVMDTQDVFLDFVRYLQFDI